MAEFARGAGKPAPPLFAPILFATAAQIEALPVADFVCDAVKLGKGLSELRRVLGTSAIVVAAASAMEAEALGARVDLQSWPPTLTSSPGRRVLDLAEPGAAYAAAARVQASLEATKRLASAESGQPVLIAVLTGPAALVQQLAPNAGAGDLDALYEFAGRALAALVRLYSEAGVHVVVLQETSVPTVAVEAWQGALGPVANVARFHKVPPVLLFTDVAPAADDWPANLLACVSRNHAGGFDGRPHALACATDPSAWTEFPDGADQTRLLLTLGEVPHTIGVADLRAAMTA